MVATLLAVLSGCTQSTAPAPLGSFSGVWSVMVGAQTETWSVIEQDSSLSLLRHRSSGIDTLNMSIDMKPDAQSIVAMSDEAELHLTMAGIRINGTLETLDEPLSTVSGSRGALGGATR